MSLSVRVICASVFLVSIAPAIFAVPPDCSRAPVQTLVQADARLSAIRADIVARAEKSEFPSISIGVMKNGRVLWEESVGWADKTAHVPATPCVAYGLASLGKSILGTAMMVLVDRKQVNLNAPISQYLGNDRLKVSKVKPIRLPFAGY